MGPETNITYKEFDMEPEYDSIIRDLKPDINNFLYSRVPGNMTIKQFEELAIKVNMLIVDLWQTTGGSHE